MVRSATLKKPGKKKKSRAEPEPAVKKKRKKAAAAPPPPVSKKSKAQKPSRPADVDTAERNEALQFTLRKSDKGRVRVSVATLSGSDYLDVRHMYADKAGDWLPTRKGCAMPLELAKKFHRRLGKLLAKAEEAGLKTNDE